jgi:formylglycine-generating enzyme required for sulfatase activity
MQSMRRGFNVLGLLVAIEGSVSVGCEKADSNKVPAPMPTPPRPPSDARLVDVVDARNDGPEPTAPPPAPTVKRGGKGDCKVEYAPRPTRDPNPMCKIAGGTFMMGSDDPKASANERPVRKVTLTPYLIDQFEVTNAQIAHFLNAAGNDCASGQNKMCFFAFNIASTARVLEENGRFRARPGFEHHPTRSATVEGAERYCAWVGKRLPTEAEWEFAARHDPKTNKDYRWPWGDKFYPKRAACDEPVCKDGFNETMKIPNSSSEARVGTFDGTGGFGDGSSPWGVHDMAGNVSEIMADVTDAYETPYPECGDCIDPVMVMTGARAYHVIRGSSGLMDRVTTFRGGDTGVIEGFRCAYR